MNNMFDTLVSVIKEDDRFFTANGELLRNSLYEAAMKMDKKLIKALYENEKMRQHFFTDIDGIAVFDKIGFSWIVNNREFLPDSYTRYKNKIGLVDRNGDFLSASNNVELAFPYKDCILEGGQTKEEQKRKELFYNESLAPEEIDRLFSEKILGNAKRYASNKKVESIKSFTDSDNLIINGNNLLAIASLKKRFSSKVKMVYWDIPYNTGSDSFGYNDSFSRSSWLVFIKNRVEQVLPLISNEDGVFLIQCSFHNYAYLKVLLDEIIGNYVMI